MKLSNKWFTITALIVGTTPLFFLFLWCAINGFGLEAVRLFESIHPAGGFSIIDAMNGPFVARIPGIIINTLYAAADSMIAGFGFSTIYNFFIGRFEAGKPSR
jgi:hypothetical protein